MVDRSDDVGELIGDVRRVDRQASEASDRPAGAFVVAADDEPPRRFGEDEETGAEDGCPDEL